jgi:hypothetical protein
MKYYILFGESGVLVSDCIAFIHVLRGSYTPTEHPLIHTLYLSSPGFNFVSMTSYANFCFMQHLRYTAFFDPSGSLQDGFAETFWFYSQNLPTVALLLPRAALSLALLLAFGRNDPVVVAMADAGMLNRDTTFFKSEVGTLTKYARGVLLANAAWTAWRVLVLLTSWYVKLCHLAK